MVAHLSVGGSQVRLRLSNHYGPVPVRIGALRVALRARGSTPQGSSHVVRVRGKTQFTIAPGSDVVTDPVELRVLAGSDLLVSLYLPESTLLGDWHPNAYETTYVSMPGNHVDATSDIAFPHTRGSFYFLTGVSVVSPLAVGTILTMGDSITDGANSTTGTNRRWPDALARRLQAQPGGTRLGVVNVGIGSTRVLTDHETSGGEAAVNRFSRELARHANVRVAIVLEGINDIAHCVSGRCTDAPSLIAGYKRLAAQARQRGVKIVVATVLPAGGRANITPELEAVRQQVNAWIRHGGAFDAVFDFDAALRDPAAPSRLLPAYDSGDHLHPSDAGMQAMADSIDLALLERLAGVEPAGAVKDAPVAPR